MIFINIPPFQWALVSWAVSRETTLDLLTVGNMTFSGDTRYSILHQKNNNWVLVIKNVDLMDEGRYICTVQTFPEQSLSVFVRVHGEDMLLSITHNHQTISLFWLCGKMEVTRHL